jgi:hypothetical protein
MSTKKSKWTTRYLKINGTVMQVTFLMYEETYFTFVISWKISVGETFKYVQMKIKTIIHKGEVKCKLIQLVDISDKILYTGET